MTRNEIKTAIEMLNDRCDRTESCGDVRNTDLRQTPRERKKGMKMKTETSMQYSERVAREQAARNEAIGHPVGSFHGTVNPDLYTAKVDSIISLCREWQNGTITWAVLLLRADVSESGAEILRSIGRGDDNAALAKTARQAVAA